MAAVMAFLRESPSVLFQQPGVYLSMFKHMQGFSRTGCFKLNGVFYILAGRVSQSMFMQGFSRTGCTRFMSLLDSKFSPIIRFRVFDTFVLLYDVVWIGSIKKK